MVTLRDPAPAGLLIPGMSTALGRRVLFLELWRLRSSSISAGWSCFRIGPASLGTRGKLTQDSGYLQKVNTIQLTIRTFGAYRRLGAQGGP